MITAYGDLACAATAHSAFKATFLAALWALGLFAMIVRAIDWRSPYAAFAPLAGEPYAHLLHGGDASAVAEWSIIVAFPESMFRIADVGSGLAQLDAITDTRRIDAEQETDRFPFLSGLVGYVGYDAARSFDRALHTPASPFDLPDIAFGAYDAAALFSRHTKEAFIVGRSEASCSRLEGALGTDRKISQRVDCRASLDTIIPALEYQRKIGTVLEDILNGDYYQANVSHQISARVDSDFEALAAFRRLAAKSDAFFGGLLQFPEADILSNSPERFFKIELLDNGVRRIVSEPIKGTRPRDEDPETDRKLAEEELLNDPKERAENIMIADLIRNDLSMICEDGSIRENDICALASFTSVHHLVSRISGALQENKSLSDVFRALFPCGSVTGAPKIAAMNAIAHAEGIGRGPYCGAIGYWDDRGKADFSVAIRTNILSRKEGRLTIPVGGGVTLRSDPMHEYRETLVKARAALEAFGISSQALL